MQLPEWATSQSEEAIAKRKAYLEVVAGTKTMAEFREEWGYTK